MSKVVWPSDEASKDASKTNLASKTVLGGKSLYDPSDVSFAAIKERKGAEAVEAYYNAEKKAPNKDKKATIKADKSIKDIASVVAQTDPQGTGQIAPDMYKYMQQIFSLATGGGGGTSRGGGGGTSSAPPYSGVKRIIEDALTGALSILSDKYSFEQLTEAFDKALANNGIKLIDKEYREIVKNALANLYTNYTLYGPGNMPYFTPSPFVGEIGPVPQPLVTVVPDLYIQQYYYPVEDPYPGYIKWVLYQDDDDAEEIAVYTERQIGDPYYVSADEEIYSIAEQELAAALDPYIETLTLTAKILNELLVGQNEEVEKNKKEKNSGKNAAKNILKLIQQLAGYAGQLSNKEQSEQLPPSVLNKGSIAQSQKNFNENIGKLRKMKQDAKKAVRTNSSAGSIGTQVLSSVLSNIGGGSGGNAQQAVQNIFNVIKS